ncbi:MAG: HupE/UreJ family protein [Chloroflexota bacterium]
MSPFELMTTFLLHATTGSGAIEGFLHPLLGLDHLLAMITVGLLSAQLGGRAIWTVPATFVGVMALGGIIGLAGIGMPLVEFGIAASVVILGVALLSRATMPEWVAMIFVGVFAVFHGYAHGAELPEVETAIVAISYVVGFLVATAGLHVIGAMIGYIMLRNERSAILMRVSGVAIAAAGAIILSGLFING